MWPHTGSNPQKMVMTRQTLIFQTKSSIFRDRVYRGFTGY
jgi:hypothetical protein